MMLPVRWSGLERSASLSNDRCVLSCNIWQDFSTRRKCASPSTTRWSTHLHRIDPINLLAKPFCQGEPGAMGLSRMPHGSQSARRSGAVDLISITD
jgi:hypothetical protein